jgi:hypothetical protein
MPRATYIPPGDDPFLEVTVNLGQWYIFAYHGNPDVWFCKVQKIRPNAEDPFGKGEAVGPPYTVQGRACTCPWGRNQPDSPKKCKHVQRAWGIRKDPLFDEAVQQYLRQGPPIIIGA